MRLFVKKNIKSVKNIKVNIRKNIMKNNRQNKLIKNTKIYHLHNSYHLGDSVLNFIFFNLIKNYIEHNNIKIFYYAKKEYLPQIKEFICSNNIFLSSIDFKPKSSIELWVNNPLFNYVHCQQSQPINYNLYYKTYLNNVLNTLKINFNINKFVYRDEDILNRYNKISDKYKNFDILILNSEPRSNQFDYKKDEWDNYIINLNSIFKILTTTKVNGVLCTSDDNLTLKDIASLSTKAKVIIAVNSGVVPGLLNIYTLTSVKHFYIFDNINYFSYPNFENKNNINDISIDELSKYIC